MNNEESKEESPQEKDVHERPSKKVKLLYEIETEGIKLITADKANKKYWDDCKNVLDKGKKVCTLIYFNFNLLCSYYTTCFINYYTIRRFWIELKKHSCVYVVKKLCLIQLQLSVPTTFVK